MSITKLSYLVVHLNETKVIYTARYLFAKEVYILCEGGLSRGCKGWTMQKEGRVGVGSFVALQQLVLYFFY